MDCQLQKSAKEWNKISPDIMKSCSNPVHMMKHVFTLYVFSHFFGSYVSRSFPYSFLVTFGHKISRYKNRRFVMIVHVTAIHQMTVEFKRLQVPLQPTIMSQGQSCPTLIFTLKKKFVWDCSPKFMLKCELAKQFSLNNKICG